MTKSNVLKTLGLALIAGLVSVPVGAPALASGTQTATGPKVCFKNDSGQRLYFKAVYSSKSTGGSKLGDGGKFCSRNPAPTAVRVSLERKSAVLCTASVQAGYTYTLSGPPKGGKCQWTRSAN